MDQVEDNNMSKNCCAAAQRIQPKVDARIRLEACITFFEAVTQPKLLALKFITPSNYSNSSQHAFVICIIKYVRTVL